MHSPPPSHLTCASPERLYWGVGSIARLGASDMPRHQAQHSSRPGFPLPLQVPELIQPCAEIC